MMVVFKVVQRLGSALESALVNMGGPSRVYPPGEWVQSGVGPLLAFDSREAAEAWVEDLRESRTLHPGGSASNHTVFRGLQLWQADGEGVQSVEFIATEPTGNSDVLPAFWRGEETDLRYTSPPPGTVGCSRLRLVKHVRTWN